MFFLCVQWVYVAVQISTLIKGGYDVISTNLYGQSVNQNWLYQILCVIIPMFSSEVYLIVVCFHTETG